MKVSSGGAEEALPKSLTLRVPQSGLTERITVLGFQKDGFLPCAIPPPREVHTTDMKVFVSAYACEPGRGSEPGVGWNWALQIARFHEVWVLTRPCSHAAISAALVKRPLEKIHWIYFDLPSWARWWNKRDRGIHLHYYLWQIGAYFVGRRLHRQVGFDLGHHVTIGCDWRPTFLCLLPFPFIWGPLCGSTHRAPMRFWKEFGWRGAVYEAVRMAGIYAGRYLDPFVWLCRRRARAIIASSEEAVAGFPRSTRNKVFPLGNVGFASDELPEHLRNGEPVTGAAGGPRNLKVFTTGRLVHWKGYSLLLKACGTYLGTGGRLTLCIGGSGPEEPRLRALAARLGITEHVRFLGELPDRASVFVRLAGCDVFAMPTLHDGPPVVFLEAMAVGKPVVCLDMGGASDIITPECGVKLAARTPTEIIAALAQAFERLAASPELCQKLGAGGRKRIHERFSWDRKGEVIRQLYLDCVSD